MDDKIVQGWSVEHTKAGYWNCDTCEYLFTIVTSFKDNGQIKADVYKSCTPDADVEYIVAYAKANEEGDYQSSITLERLFMRFIKDTQGWKSK